MNQQNTVEYPTEDAYRQWLEVLGEPTTAHQEEIHQDILRLARRLDQLHRGEVSQQGQVDQRMRLLRQIRYRSADLRESIADEHVAQAVVTP